MSVVGWLAHRLFRAPHPTRRRAELAARLYNERVARAERRARLAQYADQSRET